MRDLLPAADLDRIGLHPLRWMVLEDRIIIVDLEGSGEASDVLHIVRNSGRWVTTTSCYRVYPRGGHVVNARLVELATGSLTFRWCSSGLMKYSVWNGLRARDVLATERHRIDALRGEQICLKLK